MKNYTTPRTVSECEWTTGYPTLPREAAKSNPIMSVLLATLIGVLCALLLAHWAAS